MQWEVRGRVGIEEEDVRTEPISRCIAGRGFGMGGNQVRLSVLESFRCAGCTSRIRLSYDR